MIRNAGGEQATKAAWIATTLLVMSAFARAQATPAPSATQVLTISTRRVVVSIRDRRLVVLESGQVRRVYRVAVGKSSTPTPLGTFQIMNRVSNPTYYHAGQVIPAGRDNPVGSRWMGLSAKGYGIHGTNQPESIGKAASTGCIRMDRKDVEELFAIVKVGDPVEIRDSDEPQSAAASTTAHVAPGPGNDAVSSSGGQ